MVVARWQAGIRREVLDRILIFNQAARGCRTTTEIRDVRRCDRLGGGWVTSISRSHEVRGVPGTHSRLLSALDLLHT